MRNRGRISFRRKSRRAHLMPALVGLEVLLASKGSKLSMLTYWVFHCSSRFLWWWGVLVFDSGALVLFHASGSLMVKWILMILLQFLPGAVSWGKEGHYATCKIAEGLLSEEASAAVKELLPDYAGGDLASLCSWPDEIRHNHIWRWTSPLHYIDTPDFKCNYGYCRDCHDLAAHKDMCVAGAIYNYTSQLTAHGLSNLENYNLTEALLFLSHFMGDIHQPLHVGFTGDAGGNTIIVRWFRRKSNLHHVWDNLIIESALKKFYSSDLATMIEIIRTKYLVDSTADISLWENCTSNQTACPNPYASESISFACKYAYRNATPGSSLGDEFFLSRLPLVEKRLVQGGVRLAATLNRIFLRPHPSISVA
ncbi:hypothetical protein Taro_047019 [Colocasia esculenta]|uniref:Aspergillus nuclease S1 n=1 Tax=Colocasia esculenta TaxID=4460 RepID=A0A843X7Q8_COLES|nr:hypothetical protein [Colocasia esculenta]